MMRHGRDMRQAAAAEQQAEQKYEASLVGHPRVFSDSMAGRGGTVN
jgi:hypothetical protein